MFVHGAALGTPPVDLALESSSAPSLPRLSLSFFFFCFRHNLSFVFLDSISFDSVRVGRIDSICPTQRLANLVLIFKFSLPRRIDPRPRDEPLTRRPSGPTNHVFSSLIFTLPRRSARRGRAPISIFSARLDPSDSVEPLFIRVTHVFTSRSSFAIFFQSVPSLSAL